MKRIFCFVLVFLMCTSSVAFADNYDILSTSYNSYEADISCTLTVNEPMKVFGVLSKLANIDDYVNLQMLAENFCNSKSTGVIRINSSNDFSKGKMSYEVFELVPFKVNRNLKITAEMQIGMWFEWDISDEMNPTFKYILQQPFADKYISMDLVDMLADEGINTADYVSSVKGRFEKEYLDDMNKKLTELFRKNSTSESFVNKVTITLTDDQLENLVAEFMDLVISEFDDNEDYELLSDGESGYISDILPGSEEVKEFFDEYRLFDETALVMEFTKTPLGVLKASSTCINMNIDLGKIIMEMDDTMEIPADSSDVKFSLKADVSYKSVNGNVKVDFPVLSEENIIDFEQMIYPEHDWDGEYCYHFENYYLYDDYIEAKKDTFYMSLQSVISDAAGYGYEYDLSVDGDLVTLTETTGKERFSKAEMKVGSDEITVDGVSYTASNPVVISDGLVYVDTFCLNYIFGFDMEYAEIYLETNEINLDFERKSPQCHHTEEEIYGWFEEEEYEEECYHYDVVYASGEFPYYGVPYIKIRDVIDDVWTGCEVHYENGVLTLTDTAGSVDFTTFVITMDSNEYIIDGVSKKVGMPATLYQDRVYVDVIAITELFGFELTDPSLVYTKYYDEITESEKSYMSYNATLARKSPLCPHSDEELEDYYKWWE